jgi:hypothetical protein
VFLNRLARIVLTLVSPDLLALRLLDLTLALPLKEAKALLSSDPSTSLYSIYFKQKGNIN